MREFETGATRGNDEGKPDYEGFLSPTVIERFGEYMSKHRIQEDGKPRASDNWQKGMTLDCYMKSGFRHFMDWWKVHRKVSSVDLEESLCALMFNVMGYLHETLKGKQSSPLSECEKAYILGKEKGTSMLLGSGNPMAMHYKGKEIGGE
jgi:hypothetical protein